MTNLKAAAKETNSNQNRMKPRNRGKDETHPQLGKLLLRTARINETLGLTNDIGAVLNRNELRRIPFKVRAILAKIYSQHGNFLNTI